VDFLYKQGGFLMMKPGLEAHLDKFQLAVSYGTRVNGESDPALRDGLTLGIGFSPSSNLSLQAYYNHLTLYSFGTTLLF
jgi:hypothetical protein